MAGFNLAASLNLRAANLKQVIGDIQQELRNINANIPIKIDPVAVRTAGQLSQAIRDAQTNMRVLGIEVDKTNSAIGRFASSSIAASRGVDSLNASVKSGAAGVQQNIILFKEAATAAERFGIQAGLAIRRFAAFSVAAGAFTGLIFGFRDAIKEALEFERALIRIEQVAGDTRQEVKQIADETVKLGQQFGVSSRQLAEAALTLRQAGISVDDTRKSLEALAKASLNPNFGSLKDTTEGLVSIMAQFKVSGDEVGKTLGSINAIAGAFAVESKDLLDVVRRTGGAFQSVGGDLNQLLAIFTSVRSTTRESAESIATGLRTIFTRLQRNDVVQQLQELGINLRYTAEEARTLGNVNLTQQFVGGYEAVRRLSEGLKELATTDPRFSRVVEQLGGYREISKVIPLIQQFGKAQEALNVAKYGQGSLDSSAIKAQESYLQQFEITKQKFLELGRVVTENPFFKKFLDDALGLASALAEVLKYLTPLVPLFTTLAAVKISAGIAPFFGGFFRGLQPNLSPNAKLARGGVVPGTGSGDTVPAMLEPGEFVIRKDSAQKLGYSTLHNMNVRKYAEGGLENRKPKYIFGLGGGAIRFTTSKEAKGDDPGYEVALTKEQIETLVKERGTKFESLPDDIQYALKPAGSSISNIRRQIAENFDRATSIEDEIKTKNPIKNLIIPYDGHKVEIGVISRTGNIGEAGKKLRFAKRDQILHQNLSDDVKTRFVAGKYDGVYGTLTGHVLAKNARDTFDSHFTGPVLNLVSDTFKKVYNADVTLKKKSISDMMAPVFEKYVGNKFGANLAKNDEEPIFDIVNGIDKGFAELLYPNDVPEKFIDIKSSISQETIPNVLAKYINNFKSFRMPHEKFEKKASGGSITDTVPALLTPGEFVLNKSAASSIGLSNLHHMNKTGSVRGYAAGGLVQHFVTGGSTVPQGYNLDQAAKITGLGVVDLVNQLVQVLAAEIRARKPLLTQLQAETIAGRKAYKIADRGEKIGLLESSIATKQGQIVTNTQQFEDAKNAALQLAETYKGESEAAAAKANQARDRARTLEAKLPSAGQPLTKQQQQIKNELDKVNRQIGFSDAEAQSARQNSARYVKLAADRAEVTARANAVLEKQLAEEQIALDKLKKRNVILKENADKSVSVAGTVAGQKAIERQGGPRSDFRTSGFDSTKIFLASTALSLASQLLPQPGPAPETLTAGYLTKNLLQSSIGYTSTGAIAGSQIGSALGGPGIGTAVGAAAGLGYGVYSGYKEAEKNVSEALISNISTKLTKEFTALANGETILDKSKTEELINRFKVGFDEISKKATEEATGFFAGFDEKTFKTLRTNKLDASFGNVAVAFANTLNKQAGVAAKNSAGLPADNVVKNFTSQNANIINALALTSGKSFQEVAKDFQKVITDTIRNDKLKKSSEEAASSLQRLYTSFGTLSDAIDAASSSLGGGKNRLALIGENLGLGTRAKFSGFDNLSITGFNQQGFSDNVGRLTGFFGPAGDQLRNSALAANQIKALLPGAIGSALGNGISGQSFNEQVINNLTRGLGNNINEEVAKFFDIIRNNLGGENIKVETGGDITKLTEKALGGSFSELEKRLGDAASRISASINDVINNIELFGRAVQNTINEIGRGADIRLAAQRNAAITQAVGAGRGRSSAIDFLSLEQLNRPYNTRVGALLAGTGLNANNPEAIGARLGQVQRQRDATLAELNKNPGNINLATNFAVLGTQADRLREALRLLSDYTARGAGIQEKLNRVEEERANRSSVGEKLLTGSPEEIAKLNRGVAVARAGVENGYNIRDFSLEDRQTLFNTLNALGNTTLQGVDGAPIRASELKELFVQNSTNLGLGRLKAEENNLRAQNQDILEFADRASQVLVAGFQSSQEQFFTQLQQNQKTFLDSLLQYLQQGRKLDLQTQQSQKEAQFGDAFTKVKLADEAAKTLGLNKDQFGVLSNKRGDVANIFGLLDKSSDVNKAFNAISKIVTNVDFLKGDSKKEDIIAQLNAASGGNIEAAQINQIAESVLKGRQYIKDNGLLPGVNFENLAPTLGKGIENQRNAALNPLQQQYEQAIANLKAAGIANPQAALNIPQNQRADVLKGLEITPEKYAKAFEDATKAAQQFFDLQKQIDALGNPQNRAGGGPIAFTAAGTDTVPAMLTPGEFVVNRDSAQANRGLLEYVNNARGPAYFAEGGLAGYIAGYAKRRGIPANTLAAALTNPGGYSGSELSGLNAPYVGAYSQIQNLASRQLLAQSTYGGDLFAEQRGSAVNALQGQAAANVQAFSQVYPTSVARILGALRKNRKATGGFVDSVPAMLTPGEFVMTKSATSMVGPSNLAAVNRFADGGLVGGGTSSGGGDFTSAASELTASMNDFVVNSKQLIEGINKLGNLKIELTAHHDVNVVINGAEILTRLEPAIRDLVVGQTQKSITDTFRKYLPDVGNVEFNGGNQV